MVNPVYITAVWLPVFLYAARVGAANIPPVEELDLETLDIDDLEKLPMDNNTYSLPRRPNSDDLQCKSLRTKMQISDGFCSSIKPVRSVLCTGACLPSGEIPWYAISLKFWGGAKGAEHRCENDLVKRKRVQLFCENGETRTIEVQVVRSCVCTRYTKNQNKPLSRWNAVSGTHRGGKSSRRKHRNRNKNRRRKDRRKESRRGNGDRRSKKKSTPNRTPEL